ncbi:MAG: hypothetical protein DKT66_04000 [Candidatus Melainabacteria bacterium]|nr:MAG: hypothetical protein DKT66_04000 [Candidatus Melainabacteria bacterium]
MPPFAIEKFNMRSSVYVRSSGSQAVTPPRARIVTGLQNRAMNNTLQTESTSESQRRQGAFLKSVPSSIYIDLLLILICVIAVFGRTITSYFLADDLGEIRYLHRMCTAEPNLFLANFTGNYMQIPGMSVYRPFLLLSLLIDFFIWKANAVGFYATNLLFYVLDAALLYLIVLQLGSSKSALRNRLTALTAAGLFALSPLHCESVSWVLGRVDIVSAFFYEISFLAILLLSKSKSRLITGIALAAFISGLLVKEMAIGIPVIAFLVGWLYVPGQTRQDGNPVIAFKRAITFSWPFLAATVAYFIVRFLCLGTLVGGYVAGFGASQDENAIARWLDVDTLQRIAFPLVQGHFQSAHLIWGFLLVLYCLLFCNFAVRLLARQIPLKLLIFLGGWFVTTLLPIYKLWGIGYNLEGARFLFFFTMPLSTLLAVALFQNDESDEKLLDRSLFTVSSAVAVSLALVWGYVAAKTDLIWVNAGKEVKATAIAARAILKNETGVPAVFLGIPKESKGTHMILNGDTFKSAVLPPFAEEQPKRAFATFDPEMYSPEYRMNAQRFKSLASSGAEVFAWSSEKRQFNKVEFAGGTARDFKITPGNQMQGIKTGGKAGLLSIEQDGLAFDKNDGTQGIQLSQLHLNPLKEDYAVIEVKTESLPGGGKKQINAFVSANAEEQRQISSVTLTESGKEPFQTIYVPLSSNWKWFEKPTINDLFLTMPSGNSVVKSLRIQPEERCRPQVTVAGLSVNENGTYWCAGDDKAQVSVDASTMGNVADITLEVSKANYFFDNFKDDQISVAVDKKLQIGGSTAQRTLSRKDFTGAGFFQIRAIARDKNGAQIGTPSACITFSVH